ncbi:hypothetical protein VOLCADRAFT_80593 [Volvox carteri f. nagariensis]|uniref:Glycerol-3-phosphate dehydrogenase n=1 Tax=Volvox carteri f. nagariensis TaxID=3068 RepID=D8TSE3_VOLCA|nr:uncharacterized protein VOLCADRAFT_80593 [Volvox carteri f. nagariensis]EFJ49807.1 hypothetical protein VOLCADRAFT_80593 [Volvox carteri f. nagariensis]|eukprot:XP_002949314.1 hypothetical protein VOLCADRAFT_80593 [Volvox carteri f. nagariensis]
MPLLFLKSYLPVAAAAGAFAAVGGAGYLLSQQHQQPLWARGGPQPDEAEAVELLERPPPRPTQLERLRGSTRDRPFDVLIVGGGATGSGCALDAVTRGLRTALVERDDFGSGTSSKSTKLVHGGVRYLEKAVFQADIRQLRLVYEALHERATMLALAPNLAAPRAILTPCYKWWEVPYYWAGLKAYDLVAGRANLISSRYVPPAEALDMVPTLATSHSDGSTLKGAVLYYDGYFDDARFNVALACTAAAAGGVVANYVDCKQLIKNQDGKVVGAVVQDRLGSEPPFEVYARVVLNTTGCFVDEVRHLSRPDALPIIQPSSGAHITLPAFYGGHTRNGIIIPKTKDGRVVFMLPFLDSVIAGTTDSKCHVTRNPVATRQEVDFILGELQDYLGIQVRPSDVLSVWSGIRPLAADPRAKDTQNTVRDHVIVEEGDGLLTASGGKWTTYRLMAQEAVDAVVATGRMPTNVKACRTTGIPLLGAGPEYSNTLAAQLAQDFGPLAAHIAPDAAAASLTPTAPTASFKTTSAAAAAATPPRVVIDAQTAEHLAQAYGTRAGRVLQTAQDRNLGGKLAAGHPFLEAEVVYCVRHEYCQTPDDFLARRTRLAFLDARAALRALPRVVELMAAELGWDSARRASMTSSAWSYLTTYLPPAAAAAAATAAARGGPGAGQPTAAPAS